MLGKNEIWHCKSWELDLQITNLLLCVWSDVLLAKTFKDITEKFISERDFTNNSDGNKMFKAFIFHKYFLIFLYFTIVYYFELKIT